jgi:glycosyltransferase involved in cell wall biosynthesis
MKVSVLTPIYNVETYLPQCLDSLKRQTLQDIEFICINDGSTDGSLAILQQYAKDDTRFRIIDKPNEGYGKSMNRGIAAATGEYIGILESDDYADAGMFERLYELARAHDCDVVRSNYYTFNDADGSQLVENLPTDLCDRVINPADPTCAKVVVPTPAIWSSLYRRELLSDNKISFLETPGAAFQDTGFVMKSLIAARRVYLTSQAFIHYRVDNAGSSVKSKDKVFNVCDEYHSIERFLQRFPERRKTLIPYVNAAKFNTYRWNKNRIAWEARPPFLRVFSREFQAACNAGEVNPALTEPGRWQEFTEIGKDPQAYYRRVYTKSKAKKNPQVSVLLSAGDDDGPLRRTLASLEGQTLSRLEVLLICDPSAKATYKTARAYRKAHEYVRVVKADPGQQADSNVPSKLAMYNDARNSALNRAKGVAVIFSQAGEEYPADALQTLYEALVETDADMVVGQSNESDLFGARPISHSDDLSAKRAFPRTEEGLLWAEDLSGKMFSHAAVLWSGLGFGAADDAQGISFQARFFASMQRGVGCGKLVSSVKRRLAPQKGFRQTSITSSQLEGVSDLLRSLNDISDSARMRVIAAERAIDLYRHIWLADTHTVAGVESLVDESLHQLASDEFDALVRRNTDLPFSFRSGKFGLPSRKGLAENPRIAFIVAAACSEEPVFSKIVARLLRSIYAQDYPAFEVWLPASGETEISDWYRSQPNLHIVPSAPQTDINTVATTETTGFIRAALALTKAPYAIISDAPIYHHGKTLSDMLGGFDRGDSSTSATSQCDFVSAPLVRFAKGKTQKLDVVASLFGPARTSKRFDALDAYWGNKLFTRLGLQRVLEHDEPTPQQGYRRLSGYRITDPILLTTLHDNDFLNRVSVSTKVFYRLFGHH